MPPDTILADRSWLDAVPTARLAAALDRGGIDFRFVGGAVRDALLGRSVGDVDLATPALPDAVARAVEAGGLKAASTGIAHGTVTALVDGNRFEITTLRRDVETDGRHAVVAFTDDWRADAARRDFTMNALYADREGRIMDFFGGAEDARAGRVRFIGDPATRIAEDALRILRFFRFHAYYGRGDLDEEGLAACTKLAAMIERLSGERVRDELLKLLAAPNPAPVWQAMAEAGVAVHAIGETGSAGLLAKMIALEAALGIQGDALRRFAAVLREPVDRPDSALKARLKLSNQNADYLWAISMIPDRVRLIAKRRFGQALYAAMPDRVRDGAILAHVRTGKPDVDTLKEFLGFMENWQEPRFPLTGDDALALGIPASAELGRMLAEVDRWWRDADFAPDRDACLKELDRLIAAKAK